MNWIKIILYVLMQIMEGLSKTEATAKAAGCFGISIEEILKHM